VRLTLFKRIFLSITGVLLLLIAIGVGSITKIETNKIREMLIAKNMELVKIASKNIETGYVASRWPFEILRDIVKTPGVLFWWVVDWSDRIKLASDVKMWGKKVAPSLIDIQKLSIKDYPEYSRDPTAKIIINPLNISHLGKQWKFVLCFSEKPILVAKRRIWISNLILGVTSLVIALLLSLYISHRITSPVRVLIEGTRYFGKGNLRHRIKVKTKDEIGELALSFNQMAESLWQRTIDLEKERNKFFATVESIKDGILVIGEDGHIMIANPAIEQLLGIKREQIIGQHISKCLEDVKVLALVNRKLKEGEEYYAKEFTIIDRETGVERVLDSHISPVLTESDKGLGTVIVLRDITKEKEVDRMKSEFVSNVSHEIRTPLASIKGFTSTLLETEVSEDERKEFLTIIDQESSRLSKLIEDLLDLSRIESGKIRFDFEPVDVLEILEKMEKEMIDKVMEKKLSLEIEVPRPLPKVRADKDALLQIMVNLVGNAIKFTKRGNIWVKTKLENKHIRFSIQDTGIGIEKKHLNKIFDKFYRIETAVHEIPGTGLGLSIVKELVEKHGGKIWVESKIGEGSTFYFTIPIFVNKSRS
jgi:two-component system phosphate regulon sensor histidine kinase PhoR